ncbi:MAG: HAD family acid phosphatase [Geminicoccaceae bacterium]
MILRPTGRVRFAGALQSALAIGLTAVVLLACAPMQPDGPVLAQPPNVGEAKFAATDYYNSGAYQRDIIAVTAEASAWIAERAPQVDRPALVLDIDDTALTNWEVIVADDFGRVFDGPCDALPAGPCGWVAWDLRASTPPITQTLALFEDARALGVAIFFITGRDESQRAATEKNLSAVGYRGYRGLYMEAVGSHYASAADFKAPQRAKIQAEGFTIIANMGDQPSDLAGGHAERTFLLPNPFYRIP